MMSETDALSISVVVVVFHGNNSLARCLEALMSQTIANSAEVLVPYDDQTATVSQLKQKFPSVIFLYLGGIHTYAELRSLGIRQAGAQIIAVTEDHCVPDPDWCANILKEHQRDVAAVGGVVEKLTPDSSLNWALYFADYLRYMTPVVSGPVESLTDLNVTYKRESLNDVSETWETEFHENVVHTALRSKGKILWLSPDVVVRQKRSMTLGEALRDRLEFGRLFASTRIEGVSAAQRGLRLLASLLVPLLLLGRISIQMLKKRRWVGQFLLAVPALVLISTAWGLGELIGYFTGRPPASLVAADYATQISS